VLGIDEHFFTRKKGYATTFCDLKNHRIYDVTLGRSEAALESYFLRLEGKERVRIVCMDLAVVYRSIVKKQFPKAVIVADRFHVIRLVNHHFLACWREIDPAGSKNRGLVSLMRRHRHNLKPEQRLRLLTYLAERPALDLIYRFKQRLCYLLLKKHKTRRQCQKLVPRFLRAVIELRQSGLAQLVTLGDTLHSWSEEIGRMWRFTRSNVRRQLLLRIGDNYFSLSCCLTRKCYRICRCRGRDGADRCGERGRARPRLCFGGAK
jgi:transposase